jgi:hypothetical protein
MSLSKNWIVKVKEAISKEKINAPFRGFGLYEDLSLIVNTILYVVL